MRRTDPLSLLAEIRKLEAERDEARAAVERVRELADFLAAGRPPWRAPRPATAAELRRALDGAP